MAAGYRYRVMGASWLSLRYYSPMITTNSGTEAPARHRIGSLDGLRGIFALTVMIGHFCLFSSHFQADAFKNVALCVQFFFILSGFALSFGFMDKMRSSRISVGSFAWQRLVRLYPLHIVTMGAAAFFIPPLMGTLTGTDHLPWDTVLNLLLLQCVGLTPSWSWNIASWSISTEFWVGLAVLPAALKWLSARQAFLLSAVGYGLLFIVLGTVRSQYAFVVPGVASSVLSTASGLLMGTALYRWARTAGFRWNGSQRMRAAAGLAEFLLLAAIIYIAYLAKHGGIEFLCIAAMPILIYSTSVSGSWMVLLLESKPLQWLGHISYSLYLLHIPVLGALTLAGITQVDSLAVRFIVFFVATIACSLAAYRLIEMPIYRRWRSPSRKRVVEAQAG